MTPKNQENMTTPKDINTAPRTDPKEMELYKLSDKFRIFSLRKFSEL